MEHLVGYAKRDLIVAAAPDVADLPTANLAAAAWCAEANAAVYSETCAVPAERLEAERELLGALPSLWCEIGGKPASRKVDRLSCVRFGSARYSAPSRLTGATVLLRVTDSRLQILEPFTGEIAAEHQLVAPGEVSICDEHYGSSRAGQATPRAQGPHRHRETVPCPRRRRGRVPDRRRRGRGVKPAARAEGIP